eukprot:CAMPEP_0194483522 /NCGR_PEP_ID=MMETSP0253-20130528/5091_1 /TAXON_ID=2966 /ORGANISM="Noctiluca scintillans" /LENGTH=830 /DNA_ID=CAMNT_0039323189 /DNA_START=231 /DNA_END=2723 /DNA_ORIENTATION=-
MTTPDYALRAMNLGAFSWIPEVWTWFYIVSQDVWIVVLIWVMVVSKYGNIKLGADDEEPEFTFQSWFSMLFSAGVAVGLFYYSVAEPVWHYKGGARFVSTSKGYGNENEDAINAIMITWYHWGLHGWIPYTTIGAVIGIMSYRRGYPMTLRYILYPLIGDKVYGVLGDAVDILSIITTICGVCTSLGLGAMQMNQGLQRLQHGFYRGTRYAVPDDAKYSDPTCGGTGSVCGQVDGTNLESWGVQVHVAEQTIIIVIITFVAMVSVVTGLERGIVNLSRFTFALGCFLCLVVLFMGETYFILDSLVQTWGFYLFSLLKVGFFCDAWQRLGDKNLGLGGAPDDLGGSDLWLQGWTIFYWGWWISWGPFVGVFLARISRGRTLRQFVVGTLIIPLVYSCGWMGIFGSEGIRMQRMADAGGLCTQAYAGGSSYSASYTTEFKEANNMGWSPVCVLDSHYHGGFGKCKEEAWLHKTSVGDQCVETTTWVSVPCGVTDPSSEDPTFMNFTDPNSIANSGPCADQLDPSHFNLYQNQPDCFVPLQDSVVCLYNQGMTDMFFDQISSYGPRGFSDFLSVISLVCLFLYFVTSSDSGSMIVDMISANGFAEPPLLQRIFWSAMEGQCAISLLHAGRNLPNATGSLKALQSASLLTGLPYTFILFWCAQSLYLLVQEEAGVLDKDRKAFRKFIVDSYSLADALLDTFFPGYHFCVIVKQIGGWPLSGISRLASGIAWGVGIQLVYFWSFILFWCGIETEVWFLVALTLAVGAGTTIGFLRTNVRDIYRIKHGDMFTDLVCGIFLPMFTLMQILDHITNDKNEDPPPPVETNKVEEELEEA